MGKKRESPDPHFIFFQWGPRRESQVECEKKLLKFLKGLRQIDPVFANWKRSKREKEYRVALNSAAMHDFVEQSAFRADYGGPRVPEFGFMCDLWTTGKESEFCAVKLDIGGYGDNFQNRCWLEPPHVGKSADRMRKHDKVLKICRWIIRCWRPDVGEVSSSKVLGVVSDCNSYAPRPGWIMYSSDTSSVSLKLPSPAISDRVLKLGTLISVDPKRFLSDDKADLAHLKMVFKALNFKHRLPSA
jgi:hypothetical protein